jgi:hypothetical protein
MDVPRDHRVRFAAPPPELDAATRLRIACELADTARELKRAQLRARNPDAAETEIEAALADWLATRPGAELGDGVGSPRYWPRG